MLSVKTQRKILVRCLLTGLVLTPILLIVWCFGRARDWFGTPFDHQAFDAVAWRNMKDSVNSEGRAEMVHDLMHHQK
jgi:hypothetical protein